MFTDPQSLTRTGGSAVSLPRIPVSGDRGAFRSADNTLDMQVFHSYGRRDRHTVQISDTQISASPLITGTSFIASLTCGFWIDVPSKMAGFTPTQVQADAGALSTWLTVSSAANVLKLIAGEG
jgi:hypothetical protein